MQYLLLIYENEASWLNLSEAEKGKIFQDYMEFSQGIAKSGHMRGGNALVDRHDLHIDDCDRRRPDGAPLAALRVSGVRRDHQDAQRRCEHERHDGRRAGIPHRQHSTLHGSTPRI